MVLYDACIFCMHTSKCRLEHYRETSQDQSPPRARQYSLPPSPTSSGGRHIWLPELSPGSSSSGDTVIRDRHHISGHDSPNWRAHDQGVGDVEYMAADHSAGTFEDETDGIVLGKQYPPDL